MTCAGLFYVWGVARIPLPGLPADIEDQLAHLGFEQSLISVGTLAPAPIISAFIIVELAALIVPRWRPLRIGGPAGRSRLLKSTLAIAIVVSLLQAWIVSSNLGTLLGEERAGLPLQLTWTALMSAVAMGLWPLALSIDKHGLTSGFAVILASSTLPKTSAFLHAPVLMLKTELVDGRQVLVLGASACLVAAAVWFVNSRSSTLPETTDALAVTIPGPACGLWPFHLSASVLILPSLLASFDLMSGELVESLAPGTRAYFIAEMILLLGSSLAFTWIFNRPRNILQMLETREETRNMIAPGSIDRRSVGQTVLRAARDSILLLAFLKAVQGLSTPFLGHIAISPVALAIVASVVIDVAREKRARAELGDLVPVWPIHRLYEVHVALQILRRANIAAFPRSVCCRTLLQFFGPYAPVTIMVRTEDKDDALAVLGSSPRRPHPNDAPSSSF